MLAARAFRRNQLFKIDSKLRVQFGKQLKLWRDAEFEHGDKGYTFYKTVKPYFEKYGIKNSTLMSDDSWVYSHISQLIRGSIPGYIGPYLEWALDNVGSDADVMRKMLGLEYESAYLEEKKNASSGGEPVGHPHAIMSDATALTPIPRQEISAPLSVHEFAAYRERIWEELELFHEDYEPHQIEELIVRELAAADGGYWLLTAGPGMGKSALMSSLAKRFSTSGTCIPYVFRQERGSERENRAEGFHAYLLSYLAYQFNEPAPAAADREEALRKLLFALGAKGAVRDDAPMVIVVDGLDEMDARIYGTGNQENPLDLPSLLPPGVHVICSLRLGSEQVVPHGVLPAGWHRFDLHGRSHFETQKITVRRYVTRVCQKNEFIIPYHVNNSSAHENTARQSFVNSLCESADFNFGILKFVLNDQIFWESGDRDIQLTGNLGEFFKKYITRMLTHESYSIRAKATFLFAVKDSIAQCVLYSVLAGVEGNDAVGIVESWIRQGLITRYSFRDTSWCRTFHSTYREFLDQELHSRDKSFLFGDIINEIVNVVRGPERMRSVTPVEAGELIGVLINLCLLSGKVTLLEDVLSELEIWKHASRTPDGISTILNRIARIRYAEHTELDVRNLHRTIAANLATWIRDGSLQGRPGEFSGLDGVLHIVDNAGAAMDRKSTSSLSECIREIILME